MTEPETKRQKTSHEKAPKMPDPEWDNHKSLLKDLYINQNKTADKIHDFMLENHNFLAT